MPRPYHQISTPRSSGQPDLKQAGGPVMALFARVIGSYCNPVYITPLTANDTLSIVKDGLGLYDNYENVVISGPTPAELELRGGATDITHTAWSGVSTVHTLTIGGPGAATNVVISQQTINIQ